MNARLKLIAAALGLVVATAAVGDASAATVTKTVRTTKIVAPHAHRPLAFAHHAFTRHAFARHVRIVRPLPAFAYRGAARPFLATTVVRKSVRIVRRPLPIRHVMSRHVMSRHLLGRTVVR